MLNVKSDHFIRSSMVLLITTTIASAINYVFQFSMGRFLGPADYSILAVLFAVIYIIIAPIQAVQLTLTRFVAEFKAKGMLGEIKDLLFRSTKKVFLISAGVFLATVLLSAQIAEFLKISQPMIIIYFSFVFLVFFITAAARGFLQGLQKFRALGFNLITESTTKLVLSVLFVFAGFGVAGAIWATNIAFALVFAFAVFILLRIFKRYPLSALGAGQKSEIYSYSIPMLVALSAVTVLYSIDVILVKHFFSPAEAGIYSAAALVAKVIFFGLMPVSNVMFPKIAELKAKGEKYSGVFAKSILLVAGLSVLATAVYFIFPKFVLTLLFGAGYISGVPIMGLFGAAISLLSISYVFVNYFLASGKYKYLSVLPAFAVAEAVALWFLHASTYQVVLVLVIFMAALLAAMAALYLISAKNEKSFTDNSGI